MPDLTPPPMSESEIGAMYKNLTDKARAEKNPAHGSVLSLARAVEAHVNEQWRQRLEKFGWTIHQDGEPADASCIWSKKPSEEELKFLSNMLSPNGAPLVVETLCRIKEQG